MLTTGQHASSCLYNEIMELSSYITGFVDGEGCFSISFNRRSKLNTGIEVRPSFSISQNKKSLKILKEVNSYFDCGAVRFSKSDQTYKYEVRSIEDLVKKIIPHFKKHPLKTAKLNDFQIFSSVCELIHSNQHRNKQILKKIIDEAYKMNPSGKRKYKKAELLKFLTR